MPNLHCQESPYLIFLKAVEFFPGRGTRFFRRGWGGVVHHQTHGNAHQMPPTRSTPKPHVPKLIWGVLSLFLMSALRVLAVFVLNTIFHCLFLVTEKARFRPVCGIYKNKLQEFFHAPWRIWGASIDQYQACITRKGLIWFFPDRYTAKPMSQICDFSKSGSQFRTPPVLLLPENIS